MMKLLSSRNPYFTRFIYVVEIGLAFYLFFGGINTAASGSVSSDNALGRVLGSHAGLITFGITFSITGLTLFIAKIIDSDRLHSFTLMMSFLIMSFTCWAEFLLRTGAGDSLTLAIISGYLYLRAKRLESWRKK